MPPLAGVLFLRDERSRASDAAAPADRSQEKHQEPCRVLLHNDDYTPAEYVVVLLREVFGLGWWKAMLTMMKAHATGTALVGLFPEHEARQRVDSALTRARGDGWPLRLSVEPGGSR